MISNPLALIAEITHRCPLHCVYCSNPLQLAASQSELATEDWLRVFDEAKKMGVLHLHLTGGEPLARKDLRDLVAGAHQSGLYLNLITSGIGLSRDRLAELVQAGLDHIQLSFQDSRETNADEIAGTRSHAHKIELAAWIREHRVAFTANVVVHRRNLDHLDEILSFAEQLSPDRVEIAHTQYYGWAFENRASLMPTPEQVDRAVEAVARAEERWRGRIRIDSVVPDYYARYPKACMGGWGRRVMLINPSGKVLPCHAAEILPGMVFDDVRGKSLAWIWNESSSFQQYRGDSWMLEPCRSCDRRSEDFGGCRCQAFLLAGDAAATDPACTLAPSHQLLQLARDHSASGDKPEKTSEWVYRPHPPR
jgi:pyrroloquinoline quinone biosynthesis protein E